MTTYTSKGATSMASSSNRNNAYSQNDNFYNVGGRSPWQGCAILFLLVIVAVVLFAVVIPALS